MYKYDYKEAVCDAVREYISEEINLDEWRGDRENLEDTLNADLWDNDSVTGNASGSYYCNAYRAERAIAHNWDLLADALAEFGDDGNPIAKGAEYCDVTIRCYLLGSCISDVLDELEDGGAFDETEDD